MRRNLYHITRIKTNNNTYLFRGSIYIDNGIFTGHAFNTKTKEYKICRVSVTDVIIIDSLYQAMPKEYYFR